MDIAQVPIPVFGEALNAAETREVEGAVKLGRGLCDGRGGVLIKGRISGISMPRAS
jgi:hypothetical protein